MFGTTHVFRNLFIISCFLFLAGCTSSKKFVNYLTVESFTPKFNYNKFKNITIKVEYDDRNHHKGLADATVSDLKKLILKDGTYNLIEQSRTAAMLQDEKIGVSTIGNPGNNNTFDPVDGLIKVKVYLCNGNRECIEFQFIDLKNSSVLSYANYDYPSSVHFASDLIQLLDEGFIVPNDPFKKQGRYASSEFEAGNDASERFMMTIIPHKSYYYSKRFFYSEPLNSAFEKAGLTCKKKHFNDYPQQLICN